MALHSAEMVWGRFALSCAQAYRLALYLWAEGSGFAMPTLASRSATTKWGRSPSSCERERGARMPSASSGASSSAIAATSAGSAGRMPS